MNFIHTKWKWISIISTTIFIILLALPVKSEGEDERSSQEAEEENYHHHRHHHHHHHYSSEQEEEEGGEEKSLDQSLEGTKNTNHGHHNKIRHEDHHRTIHNHNIKHNKNKNYRNHHHHHPVDDSSEWPNKNHNINNNNEQGKRPAEFSSHIMHRHEKETPLSKLSSPVFGRPSSSNSTISVIKTNNNNNNENKKILQDGPLQRVISRHYPETQKIHIKHGFRNHRISSDKFGLHVTSRLHHLSNSEEDNGGEKEEVKNLAHDEFNPNKNDSIGESIKDGTIIKFRLSARNLPSKDKIGLSDPYVIVSYADDSLRGLKEAKDKIVLSRSSVLLNNNSPNWGETFQFEYDKKKNQRWHFAIMDKDIHGSDDLIGIVWIKVKYYVDNGQFLKIPIQLETEVDAGSNQPFPLLLIKREI